MRSIFTNLKKSFDAIKEITDDEFSRSLNMTNIEKNIDENDNSTNKISNSNQDCEIDQRNRDFIWPSLRNLLIPQPQTPEKNEITLEENNFEQNLLQTVKKQKLTSNLINILPSEIPVVFDNPQIVEKNVNNYFSERLKSQTEENIKGVQNSTVCDNVWKKKKLLLVTKRQKHKAKSIKQTTRSQYLDKTTSSWKKKIDFKKTTEMCESGDNNIVKTLFESFTINTKRWSIYDPRRQNNAYVVNNSTTKEPTQMYPNFENRTSFDFRKKFEPRLSTNHERDMNGRITAFDLAKSFRRNRKPSISGELSR